MPCVQTNVINGQAILNNVLVLKPGELTKRAKIAQGIAQIATADVRACSALIDTGAQTSCISKQVAQSLGLVSKTKIPVKGVHGIAPLSLYDADLLLPLISWGQEGISLIELDVPKDTNYHAIIGMDILGRGTLHLNYGGPGGRPGVCTFCI